MTSSQDRDGPSGQPTTSTPDNPPSTPAANASSVPTPAASTLPAPAAVSTPPVAPAPPSEQTKDGSQTQRLAPAQEAPASPQDQQQKKQVPDQDQNACASFETPARPLQHQAADDMPIPTTKTPDAMDGDKISWAHSDQNITPVAHTTTAPPWNAADVQNWLHSHPIQFPTSPADQFVTHPYMAALSQIAGAADVLFPQQPMEFPFNQVDQNSPEEDEDEDDGYAPDVTTYGRLEFDDSFFWITTRSVLIGRDQAAYAQAKKQRERERKLGLSAGTTGPYFDQPPVKDQTYTKSYISEEGGLLGPESDGEANPQPNKRRKTNSGGRVSTARQQQEVQTRSRIISSRQYIDHTPGAVLVDVDHLRPSDDFVARVRIHGKAPDIVETSKGISRDHAKIQYNSQTRVWEIVVLGRNGIFHNDIHHDKDEVLTLRSGDCLQIQSVCFKFFLTGVDNGMTGAEEDSASDAPVSKTYSQGGKEMSFDFQSREDEDKETSNSSVVSVESSPAVVAPETNRLDVSDQEMEYASDLLSPDRDDSAGRDVNETIRETVEYEPTEWNLKKSPSADEAGHLDQLSMPAKKRGPGRPPKNGIMSKREERLIKKLRQEEAKKNMPPQEPGEQPQKRKVGRPRKHPRPEDEGEQPEKRKYKPRKPKGEDGDEDADGEKPSKERSQKAKTPPLELKREHYSEEQLQKPTKNYVLLIDEIMVDAPPQGYSLKQVYKRIQKKWPYFYFNVDTKGWESSVRHNLLGSDCFQKIDGHWHRVPGVPLESGKKQRKPSPVPSPRPAGLYNAGYGHHPYQPPAHPQYPGHQPIAHNTGLSQPNLPPRYPPNGQAYQIAQGPPHRPGQQGATPNQQPPARPGIPQPQAPTTTPQAQGYANANAPSRPQYAANQAPPYNPAFSNRPPPPPPSGATPGVTGLSTAQTPTQNPAQRPPLTRPGQAPPSMPQQGFQPAQALPQSNAQRNATAPHQQQSLPNSTPPAPLGPVIDPILRDFIKDFKAEVIKQLQPREGKRSEAVAMSVINRGLGLTDRSLTPECEQYEKLILDVFHQHKATFPTVLASKRRAQEVSRAASTTPANSASAVAPPAIANKPIIGALARSDAVTTASTVSMPKPISSTAGINAGKVTVTNEQTNAASLKAEAISTGDAKTDGKAGPNAGDSAVAKPVVAAAAQGTNVPEATAPPAHASTSPASNPKPPTVPSPPKLSNSPAPGTSTNTKSSIPAIASPRPASAGPIIAGPAAVNAVAGSNPSTAPAKGFPSTQQASTGGTVTNPVATSTAAPPKPAIVNSSPNASTAVASASIPKVAAATPVGSMAISTGARGASSGQTGPSVGPATPAPNGPRAVSTSSISASANDKKDVQLLDPKLVTLILSFKKTILPTLVGRLGQLLGESLVISAVDRLLGFTDETFVQAKNEQQKQHFHEAEKALMMHLETRFKEYIRNRTTSK